MATQPFEFFLIQAKSSNVTRATILGDPQISKIYTNSMEQGRFLESSIAHAQREIQGSQNAISNYIQHYTDMNLLAVDGKLSDTPRAIKYAADSLKFIQRIQNYINMSVALVQALQQNITEIEQISANMLNMINTNLSSLSSLLQEICNWGLPGLPSMPYLANAVLAGAEQAANQIINGLPGASIIKSDLYSFDGFTFYPIGSFPKLAINFNFSFSQCSVQPQNLNIFNSTPVAIPVSGAVAGATTYTPPLGGIAQSNYVNGNLATTTIPVYSSAVFNPISSMLGSVPDPSTIVSDYQMPSATYSANIISIVPSTRDQVTTPPSLQNLRSSLILSVTLDQIVASNYNPNLVACWLFYLNLNRTAREGQWISNLQAAFTAYITPSITYLSSNATPWNNYNGVLADSPAAIPLVAVLIADTSNNIHWKLSYLEAGLLGYGRSKNYDSGADTVFLSGFTGADSDYVAVDVDLTQLASITLGSGTATFPVLMNYPVAIQTPLLAAISTATISIANSSNYQTNLAQFKFTYDQFAQAELVDRYTQFWRTYAFNLSQLLSQNSYVADFVGNYSDSLDSALNPLSTSTSYSTITLDADSRNRTWSPGSALLPIPVIPQVQIASSEAPDPTTSGWSGTDFDPTIFLARPDIQSLPLPTQVAMLKTSQNYAMLLAQQSALSSVVETAILQFQTAANSAIPIGCHVLVDQTQNILPATPTVISFSSKDFDSGNFIESPTKFEISTAGTYLIGGSLTLTNADSAGVGTIDIQTNGATLSNETTNILPDSPFTGLMGFSAVVSLNVGDLVSVSITYSETNTLTAGELYIIQSLS